MVIKTRAQNASLGAYNMSLDYADSVTYYYQDYDCRPTVC